MIGYEINLERLCKNQRFRPKEVVSSELVYPKGAVPNPQILWVKLELTNGEKSFVTLSLRDFYEYVSLPESSIGGWTEGELGTDEAGMRAHLARYKQDDDRSHDNDKAGG